jgi:demethylmenaquinone methyltransferase/2-methoxy-6-polyprenyl-1,4-benzoquinol methylase
MEKVNSGRIESQPEILRVFRSKAETRAYYNKISRVYDLLADQSEAPVRSAAMEILNAGPGERVLEVGFGTGLCLVTLAKAVGPTGRVYGIDLSDQMLELAQHNLDREGLAERAELVCEDAAKLPYPSGMMDAVLMSFTLELFDTPEIPKVLAECRRVLRPGGRIAVAGMSREGEGGIILHLFEWTHRHFPNFLDCRPIFVRRALESAGFQIERVEKRIMWVPVEIVLARLTG